MIVSRVMKIEPRRLINIFKCWKPKAFKGVRRLLFSLASRSGACSVSMP
jgi:hypothetical protein